VADREAGLKYREKRMKKPTAGLLRIWLEQEISAQPALRKRLTGF
jgi:hypothetical protein